MSLADDIIEQSADHTVPLTTLLRKLLVLASRLHNEDMRKWVLNELNGFTGDTKEDLPPHRQFGITAKGFFIGPFGAAINDQPLPAFVLDEELRWWATTAYAKQGIAAYEGMIAKEPTGKAMLYWPADMVAKYQSKFFDGYALNRAWQEIPISAIAELVDTVRTKVLQLALELESGVGDIERVISSGDLQSVAPIVQQVFHTVVYGGTALVGGNAGHSINLVDRQLIVQGDFHSLATQLRSGGVGEDDICELKEIVQTEEGLDGQTFGPRLLGWLGKAAKTVAKEGGQAAADVAKGALSAAVKAYLGI